jgi:hypothetical protein
MIAKAVPTVRPHALHVLAGPLHPHKFTLSG